MRVGIASPHLFAASPSSATEAALTAIHAVARRAPHHTFIVYTRPGPRERLVSHANVSVETYPARTTAIWEQVVLPRALRHAGLDVLHCLTHAAPLTVSMPFVFSMFEEAAPAFVFEGASSPVGFGVREKPDYDPPVWTSSLQRAAAVLVHTEYEQHLLQKAGVQDLAPLYRVPHAVSERFYPVSDTTDRDRLHRRYGLPRVFALLPAGTDAGALPDEALLYGIDAFLQYARRAALSGTAAVPLVLPHVTVAHLTALLRELDAIDRMFQFLLTGPVASEDLPTLYSEAALVLHPWSTPAGGRPMLEAMACGAPIVTTDRGAMPEFAGSAGIVVDASDASAGAGAIADYMSNGPQQLRRALEGIRRARFHSWHRAADALLDVYQQIASGSPDPERPDPMPNDAPQSTGPPSGPTSTLAPFQHQNAKRPFYGCESVRV